MTIRITQFRNCFSELTQCGQDNNLGVQTYKSQNGSNDPRNLTPQNYDLTAWSITNPRISWGWKGDIKRFSGSPSSCGFMPRFSYAEWDSGDDLKLVAKLMNRARGHQFNAAVSLAEANQTFGMIAQTAGKLARGILLARQNRYLEAYRVMTGHDAPRRVRRSIYIPKSKSVDTQLAGNWLELKYGWMPLLSDIYNGAEALSSLHDLKKEKMVVRRTREGQTINGTVLADGVVYTRAQIIANFSSGETLLQSMGLTDPLSVAWEKLPFSFVADWITPVGTYLSVRNFLGNVSGTYITSTKTLARVRTVGSDFYNIDGILAGTTNAYFSRRCTSSLSVSLPPLKLPELKMSNWQKAVTSIALVVQRVRN